MDTATERRREQRLRYHWPVWFAEDFKEVLVQGQMVDVSSTGAAFTCYSHEYIPSAEQKITTKFSVPKYGDDESFDMACFTREASICRVDEIDAHVRRVAVRFTEPLHFKPGEQKAGSRVDKAMHIAVGV